MLKEDFEHIGAEDLHQLQRAWELNHRILTGGVGGQAHDIQAGNQVAGLLLSCRSSEAGRHRMACFHRVRVRCEDRANGTCPSFPCTIS